MICKVCRKGADIASEAKKSLYERERKDEISRAKVFHAQCKNAGCFCQHRVGK